MYLHRRVQIALLIFGLPAFAGSPVPGIKNFVKVDQQVYRGAQPNDQGFQYLAKLGVKCILDLRESDDRSRAEERTVTAAGMRYVNVPMTGLTPPTDAEITRILALLEDSTAGPVFVHCKRGADRTGAVIAAYHVGHDKWDNDRALKDAMSHGMSFFQFPRQRYIREFHPRTIDASSATPADSADATPKTPALTPALSRN
jgi:protein-tyrosine phosphatase